MRAPSLKPGDPIRERLTGLVWHVTSVNDGKIHFDVGGQSDSVGADSFYDEFEIVAEEVHE